ncbi:hypothetical protein GGU10DRAFT_438028 [Lentinula aff. detonsa]|uniref:Uncharacterized protein n=1 Tax=Lentinula aff. detonsa TaxID=2804958 RepID=A0AA38KK67_9AGAR|nr:hypothetical protein GGU10DRAFT_438028 [Lentinula aff. detonsa]
MDLDLKVHVEKKNGNKHLYLLILASSGVYCVFICKVVLETLVLLLHAEIDASYSLSPRHSNFKFFSSSFHFLGVFSTISMAGGSRPGSGALNTPAANAV